MCKLYIVTTGNARIVSDNLFVTSKSALQKLVKQDIFTDIFEIYIGLGKRFNKFSSFEVLSKQQLLNKIRASKDDTMLKQFFDMLINFIHEIMSNLFSNNVSNSDIARREKYSKLYKEITALKQQAIEHLTQYSVETVFSWVENILREGWAHGNLSEIAQKANHILKIDVKRILEKEGFTVVKSNDNKNYRSNYSNYDSYDKYGQRSNHSGSRWDRYSSYGGSYNSNSSYRDSRYRNSNFNDRTDRYRTQGGSSRRTDFKLVPGLTKDEQEHYQVVSIKDFIPSNRPILIEFSPNDRLYFGPGSCVDKNVKGRCNRNIDYCRYYCCCTICGSSKHGRCHCPLRGSKA